jgi:hypothetical protein
MVMTLLVGVGAPVTASGAISPPSHPTEPARPAHFPPSLALVSTIPLVGACTEADRFTFEADGSWTLAWGPGSVDLDRITVRDSGGHVVSDAVPWPGQSGSTESSGDGEFTVRYRPAGCHRFAVTATRVVWPTRP